MPTRHQVIWTDAAEEDLGEAVDFIISGGADQTAASGFLEQVLDTAASLSQFPERGAYPAETYRFGITKYRQILAFKGRWRLVYEIDGRRVHIHGFFSTRQDLSDLQDLLLRRQVR